MRTFIGRRSSVTHLAVPCVVLLAFLLLPPESHADMAGVFKRATCDVLWYMANSLGALLMGTAVLVGIVSFALGNPKIIIVAAGVGIASFTMDDMVKMQFGDLGCNASPGGRGRSAEVLEVQKVKGAISTELDSEDEETPKVAAPKRLGVQQRSAFSLGAGKKNSDTDEDNANSSDSTALGGWSSFQSDK